MDVTKPVSRRTLLAGAAATGAALAAGSVLPKSAQARGAAGSVTLEFWTNHDAATDVPLFNKIISSFEAANPNIKIHLTNYPNAGASFDQTLIPTRGVAGALPDVWYNRTYNTADRATHGWTLPLNSFMAHDKMETSDFWPAEVAQMTWKGHLYSLPYDFSDLGIYYNKAIFDKHHVKYPSASSGLTWDDVFRLAAQFTEKSGVRQTQWGLDFTPLNFFWTTAGFVLAWGGEWYSKDFRSFNINTPGSAELFQTVQDATFKTGSVIKGSTFPAGTDTFATGKVAMVVDGSWATLQHRNDIGNRFDWDVAPVPKGPAGRLPISAAGGAWSIATTSKHPKEAWAWIKYLTSTRSAQILISEPVRSIPGRRSAVPLWVSTAKAAKLPPAHVSIFADELPHSYNLASVPYYTELSTISGTYIGNMLTSNKPVREQLAQWQTAANAAIKKYKF